MEKSKNKKRIIKRSLFFLSLLTIFTLGFIFVSPNQSNAQSNQCPLSGWAWAGYTNPQWGYTTTNGIDRPLSERLEGVGWISFSGSNPSVGTYGVEKNNNDGTLVGYAWSSNIGLIRFGGLAGPFPGGGYVARDNAKIEANNQVTGWARVCAVFASGCSGALASDFYRGNWDGWVALSGGTGSGKYGVIHNPQTGELSGWAWGGEMLGWISFRDGQNYGATLASGPQCNSPVGFDYTATVNPNLVPLAFPSSSWTGTMPAAASVVITHTSGTAEGLKILNIVPNTNYPWPTGVTANYQGIGSLCPNASCTLPISVNLTFDSSYGASNPPTNLIRFVVTVDNDPDPSRSPSAKNIDFVVSVDSSGTGGNTFNYTVSPINPVLITSLPAPSTVNAQPSVTINHAQGTPESVQIISIVREPSPALPNGVTIGNIQGAGSACLPSPGSPCTINNISIPVNFGAAYSPSVPRSIRFKVTVDNAITSRPPDEKEAFFNVVINNPPSSNACTVSPAITIIGQSVTWRAPLNNMGVNQPSTYTWFYNSTNSFGTFQSPVGEQSMTYSTLGTRTAYVEICNSTTCRNSETCNVRIVTIPEFQQI